MSLSSVLDKITAQQPKEETAVWQVGEQLKNMLRAEPHLAEIVGQDLDVKEMSIIECEKKIKAFADAHRTRNSSFVSFSQAERIIREFYGLPDRNSAPKPAVDKLIRLEDYF